MTRSALGPRGAGRAVAESAPGRVCGAGTCRPGARGPGSATQLTEALAHAVRPRGRGPDARAASATRTL